MSNGKVDVWLLIRDLDQCYLEDGSVDLKIFLRGFRTLVRFFKLLGKLFSFVASDIESKICILERYVDSKDGEKYQTVQSMIDYEKEHGLTATTKTPSGSRTLLRLHWSIEFIISFLEKVRDLKDDEKIGPACLDSYQMTLCKHHPWIIQKGAMLALRTLPTARGLAEQTCIQSIGELREALPGVIRKGHIVYKSIQTLYEDNELLDLP